MGNFKRLLHLFLFLLLLLCVCVFRYVQAHVRRSEYNFGESVFSFQWKVKLIRLACTATTFTSWTITLAFPNPDFSLDICLFQVFTFLICDLFKIQFDINMCSVGVHCPLQDGQQYILALLMYYHQIFINLNSVPLVCLYLY